MLILHVKIALQAGIRPLLPSPSPSDSASTKFPNHLSPATSLFSLPAPHSFHSLLTLFSITPAFATLTKTIWGRPSRSPQNRNYSSYPHGIHRRVLTTVVQTPCLCISVLCASVSLWHPFLLFRSSLWSGSPLPCGVCHNESLSSLFSRPTRPAKAHK